MKLKSFFRVSLLFLVVLLCSSSKKQGIPLIVNFNQRFVPVDKNLYVDKYETTVKDYQLFLREKKEAGTDCSLLIYDSTLWRNKLSWNEPYVEHYFNYPAYADYPIICISHYAANEFCKWLTEKYNKSSQKKYKKVVFRLPTEAEYIKAAISIYDSTKIFYPWGNNGLYSKKEKLCNFLELRQEDLNFNDNTNKGEYYGSILFDADIQPVTNYKPNPYGVFNIVGNVSEMIQEEGISMGGDWLSTGYNVKIKSKKRYEKGSSTVGFRVYMEIIEF